MGTFRFLNALHRANATQHKIFTALYVMCVEKWPYCMKMKSVIRSTSASKQDIDKNARTFFHSAIDEFFFFPGKSIGACAYSAFIIDSWINIEHILWYFRSTSGGKRRRETIENVAADCAYGVRNQEEKTHRDTKPIYAVEGYQTASNRTRLRRTRPEKKHNKTTATAAAAQSWNVFQKVASVRRPRSPSSSSSSLWFFRHSVCICRRTSRKISKYLLCATQMHWAQRATWNYFQVDPFFLALLFARILCFSGTAAAAAAVETKKLVILAGIFRFVSFFSSFSNLHTYDVRHISSNAWIFISFAHMVFWSTTIYEFDSSINGGDSDGRNK